MVGASLVHSNAIRRLRCRLAARGSTDVRNCDRSTARSRVRSIGPSPSPAPREPWRQRTRPKVAFSYASLPLLFPVAACHQRKRDARALADSQRPGWVTGALAKKLPRLLGLCLGKSKSFTANESSLARRWRSIASAGMGGDTVRSSTIEGARNLATYSDSRSIRTERKPSRWAAPATTRVGSHVAIMRWKWGSASMASRGAAA